MIQVLVLLQSATTRKASVISEIKIVNDGTGNGDYGNYDVELIPDMGPRIRARVEDFRRALGCEALLMEALMTINEQDDLENGIPHVHDDPYWGPESAARFDSSV